MVGIVNKRIKSLVEMYYNDELRIINRNKNGTHSDYRYTYPSRHTQQTLNDIKASYYLDGSRIKDPIYNDKKAPLQIHCFGDSWTYGWDIKQEETFTHLLGDENTSVWNYGAGRTGLDYAVKKLTEVYQEFNHKENQNFIYVISIPHSFRRMHFEDCGVGRRTWEKEDSVEVNEYNHYLYFLHHYNIINRLIGRDKIIWGTWDGDISGDKVDLFFEKIDDTISMHPGPKSHKLYAKKIKNILRKNGWYGQGK